MLALDRSRSNPVGASVLNGVAAPEFLQSITNCAVCTVMQLLSPLPPLLPLPLHMQFLLPPSPLQLPLLPMVALAIVTAVKSGGAAPNGLTKPIPSTDPPMEN